MTILNPSTIVGTTGISPKTMYLGSYSASVVANNDPLGIGRVTLRIPQILGTAVSNWASPSGIGQINASPSPGTLVNVQFTGGDINYPIYFYTSSASVFTSEIINCTDTTLSALQVTGTTIGDGVVKIVHNGQANGSDATSTYGLSVNLNTTIGGSTGTQARGILITSTTDTTPPGNAITVRYNGQDWFVVKGVVGTSGAGIVGIGVSTDHTPSGMLEIAQKDTSTIGVFMKAISSGTDIIRIQDSGSTNRFQIANTGSMTASANAFFTSNVTIGATTASVGGAGSAIQLVHTTDPSTGPSSGSGLVYVNSTGDLAFIGNAGNVTTLAFNIPTGWTGTSLVGNFTSGSGIPRFRLETIPGVGNIVRLDGTVVTTGSTSANATMFTLPVGYRPQANKRFAGVSSSSGYAASSLGTTLVQVLTSGVVQCVPANNATGQQIVLDGMIFPVD